MMTNHQIDSDGLETATFTRDTKTDANHVHIFIRVVIDGRILEIQCVSMRSYGSDCEKSGKLWEKK